MPTERFTIKEWNENDRPREKMLRHGAAAMSDAELLAIVIGSGCQDLSAVDVAQRLLHNCHDDLQLLGQCSVEELQRQKGIGSAKAVTIAAVMELGRRRARTATDQHLTVSSSKDVSELFRPIIGDLVYEEFWIALLNRSHRIIGHYKISQGGLTSTTADVRLILKKAVDKLASGLILCHNHPSGNLHPSHEDIVLTSQLKQAAKLVDILLLDHIIVGSNGWFSFADEGMM